MKQERYKIERDVEAFLIPSGDKVTIKKGEIAIITQALGGSYTLMVNGNLFKINGKDADAIGKEVLATTDDNINNSKVEVNEQQVWDQLKTVYDPEIPVNIVDLGLVYDCKLKKEAKGTIVNIQMTLTAPGCGMGPIITGEAQHKVEGIPGVSKANVELVWEPAWNRDMMSETALLQLGIL